MFTFTKLQRFTLKSPKKPSILTTHYKSFTNAPKLAQINTIDDFKNSLQKFSIKDLDIYLSDLSLKKVGKKQDKINRISDYLINDVSASDTEILSYYSSTFNINANNFKNPEISNKQTTPIIHKTTPIPTINELEQSFNTIDSNEIFDESIPMIDGKNSFIHKNPIKIQQKIEFGDNIEPLILETSRISQLCDGAVIANMGGNIVLGSAVASIKDDLNISLDNFELKVDAFEKSWAKGFIPNNMERKDTTFSENEILLSRLIDRSIRPMFGCSDNTKIWNGYELQVISNLLSMDGIYDRSILGINSVSASVNIMAKKNGIEYDGPVAAVKIGYDMNTQKYIINGTESEMNKSVLNLLYVGTNDKCVMIETDSNEIDEDLYIGALLEAQKNVKLIINGINKLTNEYFNENEIKNDVKLNKYDKREIQQQIFNTYELMKSKILTNDNIIYSNYTKLIKNVYNNYNYNKIERDLKIKEIENNFITELSNQYTNGFDENLVNIYENIDWKNMYKTLFYELNKTIFRDNILINNKRCDGRDTNEIRKLNSLIDIIPSSHGSSLFERGNTQSICNTVLGKPELSRQRNINLPGHPYQEIRLYFQYEMPPYSTNEIKQIMTRNRREIGHANLAKKSLQVVLPTMKEFKYFINFY